MSYTDEQLRTFCDGYAEAAVAIAKDEALRARFKDGPLGAGLHCYASARAQVEADRPEIAHEAGLAAVVLLCIAFGEDIGRKKAMGQ